MNKLYLNLRNSLFRYLLPVGCLLFWGLPAAAQSGSNARITIHADEQPVIRILNRIGEQSGCSIILRDNDVDPDLKVSLHVDNATLGTALRQLLSGTDLTYQIDGRKISVFRPPAIRSRSSRNAESPGCRDRRTETPCHRSNDRAAAVPDSGNHLRL